MHHEHVCFQKLPCFDVLDLSENSILTFSTIVLTSWVCIYQLIPINLGLRIYSTSQFCYTYSRFKSVSKIPVESGKPLDFDNRTSCSNQSWERRNFLNLDSENECSKHNRASNSNWGSVQSDKIHSYGSRWSRSWGESRWEVKFDGFKQKWKRKLLWKVPVTPQFRKLKRGYHM